MFEKYTQKYHMRKGQIEYMHKSFALLVAAYLFFDQNFVQHFEYLCCRFFMSVRLQLCSSFFVIVSFAYRLVRLLSWTALTFIGLKRVRCSYRQNVTTKWEWRYKPWLNDDCLRESYQRYIYMRRFPCEILEAVDDGWRMMLFRQKCQFSNAFFLKFLFLIDTWERFNYKFSNRERRVTFWNFIASIWYFHCYVWYIDGSRW